MPRTTQLQLTPSPCPPRSASVMRPCALVGQHPSTGTVVCGAPFSAHAGLCIVL
jgi:hypothetical protein